MSDIPPLDVRIAAHHRHYAGKEKYTVVFWRPEGYVLFSAIGDMSWGEATLGMDGLEGAYKWPKNKR